LIKKLTGAVLLRVVGYFYQPLLVPLLILILGLPGYGQLSAAMAIAAIAMAFCEYGHTATLGTRIAAYSAGERDTASSLSYAALAYQKIILLAIATAFIYLWTVWLVHDSVLSGWLLIVVIACVIVPEVITPTWYYIGTGRLTRLLVYQLIGRIVAFIAAGWLAYQKLPITTAGAAFLCGLPFMTASFLSNQYFWSRTRPKWTPIASAELAGDMRRQAPYFLGAFSSSISPSIFLLLVTMRFTSETLGQYAIAGVAWGALRQLSQLGSNVYLTDARSTLPQKASRLVLRASSLGIFCSVATMLTVQLIIFFFSYESWFAIDYSLACRYLFVLAVSVIFYSINFSIGLHIFCSASQRARFTFTQAAPIVVFVALSFLWPAPRASDMALLMLAAEFSGLFLALLNMRKVILKLIYD
jgi:O-antigen/teichoic acid export membrane protein